jgi:hypothetical protein
MSARVPLFASHPESLALVFDAGTFLFSATMVAGIADPPSCDRRSTVRLLPPVFAVGVQPDSCEVVFALLPVSTVQLGADGPKLEVNYAAPARPQATGVPRSVDEVAAHYFDKNSKRPAGQHTMMVREAFSTVQRKQKRKSCEPGQGPGWLWIMCVILLYCAG